MSQELPDPYENARIKFGEAVRLWQQYGASLETILIEVEFQANTSMATDPAAVMCWITPIGFSIVKLVEK